MFFEYYSVLLLLCEGQGSVLQGQWVGMAWSATAWSAHSLWFRLFSVWLGFLR